MAVVVGIAAAGPPGDVSEPAVPVAAERVEAEARELDGDVRGGENDDGGDGGDEKVLVGVPRQMVVEALLTSERGRHERNGR